jgi:RimJ/RimL family protein N-acetyltransferase
MTTTLADGIRIRPATLADIESFRELRLEALQNHPTAFGQDYAEALSRPQKYWEETLTINNEEEAIFLAEDEQEGKLIGMTGIYHRLSNKSKHSATIWGVYVRPQWRGNHVAEALIRSCLAWAKEHDVIIVKLAAVTSNQAAIHSYERCGFSTYGIEPKVIFHDDQYYDEYLMSIGL